MDQLRIMVCGSVDDGKSTLVGRFFHELGQIKSDQVQTIEKASQKNATGREKSGVVNLAYFTDGLRSEVENGITIDVAYRYLDMAGRRLVVADAPGHFEFTRNMVTACSQVDAVVLLLEGHSGLKEQTRRHLKIAQWMKIPRILAVVNKMDLCGFSQEIFLKRKQEIESEAGMAEITVIPACALEGHGILSFAGSPLSWFRGPSLLDWLKQVPGSSVFGHEDASLRLSIQGRVLGAGSDEAGTLAVIHSGRLQREDCLQTPEVSGLVQVLEIQIGDQVTNHALPGDPVFLKLDREVAAGTLLTLPEKGPLSARRWKVEICPLLENLDLSGKEFWLRTLLAEKKVRVLPRATSTPGGFAQNEIQEAVLEFAEDFATDTRDFSGQGDLGRFVLLSLETGGTIAAGFFLGV
ncbi:MAG: hypothetical protein JNL01_07340 [Bdellovibrionales bacterium]|nr:hypothetical protein [Bdellovibrionales bacterium]